MISRKTIFSLLLALLFALCLRVWAIGQRDACDGLLPGGIRPTSMYVEQGTRTVEVPCNIWLLRQPTWFLTLCLTNLAIVVVFLLSACGDWVRWRRRRQEGKTQW